jgi:hypothetical protein
MVRHVCDPSRVTSPNASAIAIRTILLDGTPHGIRIVDRLDWTGTCLVFGRADYPRAKARPELSRTGFYLLVGPDPSKPDRIRLYIGQGEQVRARLDEHLRKKEFWTAAYVITAKDDSLDRAHAAHLEARLVARARETGLAVLDNGNRPALTSLGEWGDIGMARFLDEALTTLGLLGISYFDQFAADPAQESALTQSETYYLRSTDGLIDCRGREDADGFLVFAESLGRRSRVKMTDSYGALRERLKAGGILVEHDADRLRLIRSHRFDSPSAAAAVMVAGSRSGLTAWKDKDNNTLKENQEKRSATAGANLLPEPATSARAASDLATPPVEAQES